MRKYFNILRSVKLFENMNDSDLDAMLSCLGAKIVHFKKDETILAAGGRPEQIGIILKGDAQVIREDMNGGRILVTALKSGDFFAEALCCAGVLESPVSIVSNADTIVMLLSFDKILHTCSNSCAFHTELIKNMLFVIAEKNLMLQSRLDIIGKKTLRMKILYYLKSCAAKQNRGDHGYLPENIDIQHNDRNVTIPFNREELADFLCVDRSALSHELSRMKRDGILEYHKNHFKIISF